MIETDGDFHHGQPGLQADPYCGHCGSELSQVDSSCGTCAAAATPQPLPSLSGTRRPNFLLATVLYGVLLASFIPFVLSYFNDNVALGYAIENTVQIFDTLVVLGVAIYFWQAVWPLLKTFPVIMCLSAVSTGVVTISIATVFIWIAVELTGIEELLSIQPAFDAGYGWTFLIFSMVVQPAIIEELAFRGIIFDGVRTLLSDTETVVVTALLFMVLHLSPAAFPHLFIMGLLVGWMRLKTGSLWPCILLHATHNALSLVYEYRVYG